MFFSLFEAKYASTENVHIIMHVIRCMLACTQEVKKKSLTGTQTEAPHLEHAAA